MGQLLLPLEKPLGMALPLDMSIIIFQSDKASLALCQSNRGFRILAAPSNHHQDRTLDNSEYQKLKSVISPPKPIMMTTHCNRLFETILMSGHYMGFDGKIRQLFPIEF